MTDRPKVIVIVASLLKSDEPDFLGAWGLQKDFKTSYFDERGKSVTPNGEVAVVVVHGGIEAAQEVVAEVKARGGPESVQALFHPGGGLTFKAAVRSAGSPPSGEGGCWNAIKDRAFAWNYSGSGARRKLCYFLMELGRARDDQRFVNALAALRSALDAALSVATSTATAESRTEFAVSVFDSFDKSKSQRARGPANPLAVIIHDTIGSFDAIRIELDSAKHNSVYLSEACAYYKGRATVGLERLRAACGLAAATSASQWLDDTGIPTIQEIVKEIENEVMISEPEEAKVKEAALRLTALLDDRVALAHKLMAALDDGCTDRVSELMSAGADESFRWWVGEIRAALDEIDRLNALRRPVPEMESE